MMRVRLRRRAPGDYVTLDGRYEVQRTEVWLDGECECIRCQGYMHGSCPNGGAALRVGWHIWDLQDDEYASFAPEPQQFATLAEARDAFPEPNS